MTETKALEEKIDRILTLLESPEPVNRNPEVSGTSARTSAKFWALEGLRAQLVDDSGDVMLVGAVALPTGETYDWQQSASAAALIDTDWPDLSDTISALAHPVRLAIVQAVVRGHGSTAELADLPDLGTTGQLHHHLRQLAAAGWLQSAGRGHYEVPAARVVPLLTILVAATR
ncbi:helix-turn-helix domain-containing protein [Arthrobacter sp. ATA002]|uniref:ArsR/SmtB family transcription factor n=1 Tax=Arthrobacter sp. ATA002 TaxID=2991715 RepID=UPI0022A793A1|nr:helix-turn-helix domain-containing protein [Arthrobacter sp. ATA002]WAP53013.1 helix-turn-helix domain-containing protein [Arthrobacter sp. ATA002]